MMTPRQYRQKAREAFEAANAIGDPATKAAWEATAHDWLQLARAAELQERLYRAAAGLAAQDPPDDDEPDTLQ